MSPLIFVIGLVLGYPQTVIANIGRPVGDPRLKIRIFIIIKTPAFAESNFNFRFNFVWLYHILDLPLRAKTYFLTRR